MGYKESTRLPYMFMPKAFISDTEGEWSPDIALSSRNFEKVLAEVFLRLNCTCVHTGVLLRSTGLTEQSGNRTLPFLICILQKQIWWRNVQVGVLNSLFWSPVLKTVYVLVFPKSTEVSKPTPGTFLCHKTFRNQDIWHLHLCPK